MLEEWPSGVTNEEEIMRKFPKKKSGGLFTVKLVLFKTKAEGKNEGRLSLLICGDRERYVSWHTLTRLNNEFKQKFGKDMPGLISCYNGQVRSSFRYDQFLAESTMIEKAFLAAKIPENVINADLSGSNSTISTAIVN